MITVTLVRMLGALIILYNIVSWICARLACRLASRAWVHAPGHVSHAAYQWTGPSQLMCTECVCG